MNSYRLRSVIAFFEINLRRSIKTFQSLIKVWWNVKGPKRVLPNAIAKFMSRYNPNRVLIMRFMFEPLIKSSERAQNSFGDG